MEEGIALHNPQSFCISKGRQGEIKEKEKLYIIHNPSAFPAGTKERFWRAVGEGTEERKALHSPNPFFSKRQAQILEGKGWKNT